MRSFTWWKLATKLSGIRNEATIFSLVLCCLLHCYTRRNYIFRVTGPIVRVVFCYRSIFLNPFLYSWFPPFLWIKLFRFFFIPCNTLRSGNIIVLLWKKWLKILKIADVEYILAQEAAIMSVSREKLSFCPCLLHDWY